MTNFSNPLYKVGDKLITENCNCVDGICYYDNYIFECQKVFRKNLKWWYSDGYTNYPEEDVKFA